MMRDYSKIRDRVRAYNDSRQASVDIGEGDVTAIVRMPVESGRRFLQVSDLKSMSDIPKLPERMRDFAFRCATEYKPNTDWAKVFGVTVTTIERWKARPDVAQVIALTKFERRAYLFGMMTRLERRSYERLFELLSMRITGDTAVTALQTVKYIHSLINGGEDLSSDEKRTLNINIGAGPAERYGNHVDTPSPFRTSERDVTDTELLKWRAEQVRSREVLELLATYKKQQAEGVTDPNDGSN